MVRLKEICYRGGIARFAIPALWKEEYEPAGGATFYDDRPDSGILRLNVLTFGSNGQETADEMVASLIAKNGYEPLHNGLAIQQYVKSAKEDGEDLQIYHWDIAVPAEPCSVNVAIFSFTILAAQGNDDAIREEIELLQRSILAAEFWRGEGVSCNDDDA